MNIETVKQEIVSNELIVIPAGKLIEYYKTKGNEGFENVKDLIDKFESQEWVKRIVFKGKQRILYHVLYVAELNEIMLGIRMSDEDGNLTYPPSALGNQYG